jgi:hypothetical protein
MEYLCSRGQLSGMHTQDHNAPRGFWSETLFGLAGIGLLLGLAAGLGRLLEHAGLF